MTKAKDTKDKGPVTRAPSLGVELRKRLRVDLCETRSRELPIDELVVVDLLKAVGMIPANAMDVKMDARVPRAELIGRVSWTEQV